MIKNYFCSECRWHFKGNEEVTFLCPKCGSYMVLQEERIAMEL